MHDAVDLGQHRVPGEVVDFRDGDLEIGKCANKQRDGQQRGQAGQHPACVKEERLGVAQELPCRVFRAHKDGQYE